MPNTVALKMKQIHIQIVQNVKRESNPIVVADLHPRHTIS